MNAVAINAEQFAYHGTRMNLVSEIQKHGLLPNDGTRGIWPDEYPVEGRLFMSVSQEGAEHYAQQMQIATGDTGVVLKFPCPDKLQPDPYGEMDQDHFVEHYIPSEHIEVCVVGDGCWQPLDGIEPSDLI